MQPGAATNLCRRAALGLAMLAAACASAAPAYEPGKLTPGQVAKCRAVEAAYRSAAAEYPALRDEAKQDPVVTCWLVRMFVRDVITVREAARPAVDDDFFRAVTGAADPAEARALAEVRELGVLAVPTLVGDLLQHAQTHPRELGIELLALVGEPARPALKEVAHGAVGKSSRAAARALAMIGVDADTMALLRSWAGDADYLVRAEVLRCLRFAGRLGADLLIECLRTDADPFVRRVAAETLAHHKARATGEALVDYLDRCKREQDWAGERAAQLALQRMVGKRGPRTPEAWREAAAKFGDLPVDPHAGRD